MSCALEVYGLLQRAERTQRCCPWFDRLTISINSLKTLDLIQSLSKDEAKISVLFQQPFVVPEAQPRTRFMSRTAPRAALVAMAA